MAQTETVRLRLEIQGAVQGVGFRPFVFRLARELDVTGWVLNDPHGVFLEVEGPRATLESFRRRLSEEHPPRAVLHRVDSSWHEPRGYPDFQIRASVGDALPTAVVLPDVATCPECLAELLDPGDRRHRYPFLNCTHCGPRFTIVRELPYDRPHTTMREFVLCRQCAQEYSDPLDRRFHAQPTACARCGPRVALWNPSGETLAGGEQALAESCGALRQGRILAVKGLGGFHLLVDARRGEAVAELRRRKGREEKPLAVMVRDLAMAAELCRVDGAAAELLASPEAPIVLLPRLDLPPRRDETESPLTVAEEVAPGHPYLGLMLPYTPLHHLLLRDLGFPVVATSGNRSDEPIATDNLEALERLGEIADLFLVHDRPIARHVDDSVAFVAAGEPRLMRRARGWAPMPVRLPRPAPTLLAVGGHLKATVALAVEEKVFLSQHLGDLDHPKALEACREVIDDFLRLYRAEPVAVVHDLHPDYASTRLAAELARRLGGGPRREPRREDPWERLLAGGPPPGEGSSSGASLPLIAVQHHHAHLAACLAEHGLAMPGEEESVLGVIWDGTGYGPDRTVWGGELLVGSAAGFSRFAHLRPFRLPGGEAAVVEPRRVALALLWEMEGGAVLERDLEPLRDFAPAELRLLGQMLERGFRAPVTTSAGRLFDGVAALLGLRQVLAFEGQGGMAVESAADPSVRDAYPLPLRGTGSEEEGAPGVLDWQPLLEALLEDRRRGAPVATAAARFHNALAEGAVAVARRAGRERVALSGGCFQNRLLTEVTARRLREEGFEVLIHRQVPANDGGLALGQVAVAAARLAREGGDPEAQSTVPERVRVG